MDGAEKVAIALVGNPGMGKSTILNGLAGCVKFKSGISIGGGLTQVLERYDCEALTIYDTPGLLDAERTTQAGKELDKLLCENVALKIAFVVNLDNGRARKGDIYTIRLVLDAISIGTNNRFGVIVNKVGPAVAARLEKNPKEECNLRKLLTGNRETSFWCYVPYEQKLFEAQDQLYLPAKLNLFLHSLVETKPRGGAVRKIDLKNFEELKAQTKRQIESVERASEAKQQEMMANYELQKQEADERMKAMEGYAEELKKELADLRDARRTEDLPNEPKRELSNVRDQNTDDQLRGDSVFSLSLLNGAADKILPKDLPQVIAIYERAAEAGHVGAMFNLRNFYMWGAKGVPKNVPRSNAMTVRAADGGHPEALFNLAMSRLDHGGVYVTSAYQALKKAADSGHQFAMYLCVNAALKADEGLDVPSMYGRAAAAGYIDLSLSMETFSQIAAEVNAVADAMDGGSFPSIIEAMLNMGVLIRKVHLDGPIEEKLISWIEQGDIDFSKEFVAYFDMAVGSSDENLQKYLWNNGWSKEKSRETARAVKIMLYRLQDPMLVTKLYSLQKIYPVAPKNEQVENGNVAHAAKERKCVLF